MDTLSTMPKRVKLTNRGAAAVADEGQGNAHHRHEPDDYAHG